MEDGHKSFARDAEPQPLGATVECAALTVASGWLDRAPEFDDPGLRAKLDAVPLELLDDLDFGLIVMDRAEAVIAYNTFESRASGLSVAHVLGRNFFTDVGPCTNNYLVAERFRDGGDLDEQLDYVFTLRMAPTPVRLRLMARDGSPRQYLAVLR